MMSNINRGSGQREGGWKWWKALKVALPVDTAEDITVAQKWQMNLAEKKEKKKTPLLFIYSQTDGYFTQPHLW